MQPRSYTRLNQSCFDLYAERDQLPWYLKAITTLAIWLALAGYVLFALVFTSDEDNVRTSRHVLTTLAASLLIIGYVAVVLTAAFCHSMLFLLEAILIPTIFMSSMGIFVTVANHGLHKTLAVPTQAYIVIPLVTSCITTILSAAMTVYVYFRVRSIKQLEDKGRKLMPYGRTGPGPHADLLDFVPESEAQRRQLLRLLASRENRGTNIEDVPTTYRIDLPGEHAGSRGRVNSMPTNAVHSPLRKWSVLSNLVPSRTHSPITDSFKPPRERRRDEIEQASILSHDSSGHPWSGGSPQYTPYSATPARYV